MKLSSLQDSKYRWIGLIFLSLALAIVIIDNSVLNPAIPTILRDLNTSLDAIQWVISGYALIIAAIIITMGRVGDMVGRRRVFRLGAVIFAVGSFVASVAPNAGMLFVGESLIEAFGAAMMLTSTLSLLAGEFQGRERAIAFGVWGSVAGAAAALGPLLGGYLTTYHSWRWSLRINVVIALVTILGSVFIKESRGASGRASNRFDWWGMLWSGLGLFALVFGFIEGNKYGWWTPKTGPSLQLGWNQHLTSLSITPLAFAVAIICLSLFIVTEYLLERRDKSPLLKLSNFRKPAFSLGLATLGIISMGQFGVFLILPIYLQGVLGLTAFQTGIVFLSTSISVFIFGPISAILASRIGPKWIVSIGMVLLTLGTLLLIQTIGIGTTGRQLAPALIEFGIGLGMCNAQLTNIILSAVRGRDAGEASAASNMLRQVGTSVGIAIIGTVLASSLASNVKANLASDASIPTAAKSRLSSSLNNLSAGNINAPSSSASVNPQLDSAIKLDIDESLVDASKAALKVALIFSALGTVCSLFIPVSQPGVHPVESEQPLAPEPA